MIIVALSPIVLCALVYVLSRAVNKQATTERDTANCLVVLSGMLAAVAILVPLGATLLPESKGFGWWGWLLAGALATGVLCLFGIVFCMIKIQDTKTFKPSERRFVPSWVNATWIALGVLAFASVLVRVVPLLMKPSAELSVEKAGVRFAVARELPPLGTNRETIEKLWGIAATAGPQELRYRTKDGTIVFCLDSKNSTHSIVERQEVEPDAVAGVCGQN